MAEYVIPTIQSIPQLQRQLNALLGSTGAALDLLTVAYVTDELSVPLQTEDGALLEMDP